MSQPFKRLRRNMIRAKTSVGYLAILLALEIIRSKALVPSVRVACSGRDTVAKGCCRGRSAASKGRTSYMSGDGEHDILLRVAQGEKANRSPVWLMRQVRVAGSWLFCMVLHI